MKAIILVLGLAMGNVIYQYTLADTVNLAEAFKLSFFQMIAIAAYAFMEKQ